MPALLAAVMGLACLAQLAVAVRGFWPAARPLSGAGAGAASLRSPAPAPGATVELLRAHLFGLAADAGAPDPRAGVTPLVLAGTVATGDPRQGLALIGRTAASATLFSTDGGGAEGIRLREVYADRVVIERGGARETLHLPRSWVGGGATLARAPGVATSGVRELSNAEKNRAAMTPAALRQRDPRGELFRAWARIDEQGQVVGYRVLPGRDRKRFEASGLRVNDLITSVDGVALDGTPRAQVMLTAMVTQPVKGATVTIVRDGVARELVIAATDALAQ
ncbi:MAG TPA: type II secretion system protein N [Steroidobacteraceae bacterium]|nr:type II secretion system protein N [Steroidobacteraceae bacterium]